MTSRNEPVDVRLAESGYLSPSYVASGSSADVYSAISTRSDRLVAIKILKDELAASDDFRSQFLKSNQHVQNLISDTPNDVIAPVVDVGTLDGRPYSIMPFATGGTLASRLDATAEIDQATRLGTATLAITALTDSLQIVHDTGLIHRDVKPSNLLIYSSGVVGVGGVADRSDSCLDPSEILKLSDFGLATSYRELSYHGRLPAGTPGYAAPETLSANPEWSPQADIYSATVCVVEILLGHRPPQLWADELLSLGYSKGLISELRRGTSPDPKRRLGSFASWGHDLHEALGQTTTNARRWLLAGAAAALIAASSVGLAWRPGLDVSAVSTTSSAPASAQAAPSPESIDETTTTTASLVETLAGSTFECTIYFDQMPSVALGYADIGEGGAVPGEGDCGRINLTSSPQSVDPSIPWSEMEFKECQTLVAEEIRIIGDYILFVKPVGADEISLPSETRWAFREPTRIEYLRFLVSDSAERGPGGTSYMGLCKNNLEGPDAANQLDFHLDDDNETIADPNHFD